MSKPAQINTRDGASAPSQLCVIFFLFFIFLFLSSLFSHLPKDEKRERERDPCEREREVLLSKTNKSKIAVIKERDFFIWVGAFGGRERETYLVRLSLIVPVPYEKKLIVRLRGKSARWEREKDLVRKRLLRACLGEREVRNRLV